MAESRLDILKRIGASVVGKVSGVVSGTSEAVSPSRTAVGNNELGFDELSGLMKDAIDLDMQRNNLLEQNYDATMRVVSELQKATNQDKKNEQARRASARELAAEGVRGGARAVRGTVNLGRDAAGGAANAVSGAFKGLLGAPGELLKGVASGIGSFANPKTIVGAGIIAGLGFGFIKLLEGVTKFTENNSVQELVKEGGTLALLVGGLGLVAAQVTKALLLPVLAIMGGLTLATLGIAYAIDLAAPGLSKLTDSLSNLVSSVGSSGTSLLDLALGLGALGLALPAFAAGTAVAAGINGLMNLFGAGNPLSEITDMLDSLPDEKKVQGLESTLNNISQRLKLFTGELSEMDFNAVREAGDSFRDFADSYDEGLTSLGVRDSMVDKAAATAKSTGSKIFQGLKAMATGEDIAADPNDPRIGKVSPSTATQLPTAVPSEMLPVIVKNESQPIPVEFMPTPDGTGMLAQGANFFQADQYVVHNHYNTTNTSTQTNTNNNQSQTTVVTPATIAGG